MKKAHLHLIKWGLAKGYKISVYIEGEVEGTYKTYNKTKWVVEQGDIGCIDLIPMNEKRSELEASFAYCFDWGQEPDEIIYDMTDNEVSRQWLKDYEEDNSINELEIVTNNNYDDSDLDEWDIK